MTRTLAVRNESLNLNVVAEGGTGEGIGHLPDVILVQSHIVHLRTGETGGAIWRGVGRSVSGAGMGAEG